MRSFINRVAAIAAARTRSALGKTAGHLPELAEGLAVHVAVAGLTSGDPAQMAMGVVALGMALAQDS